MSRDNEGGAAMAEMEQWERDRRHGERAGWTDAMACVVDVVNELGGHDREFASRILTEVWDRLKRERDIRLPLPPAREKAAVLTTPRPAGGRPSATDGSARP